MKQHYCQILAISIFFFFMGNTLSAQCPDITSESISETEVCAGDQISLNATGTTLPEGGVMEWYYSTNQNFDPYAGEGTLMGSGNITNTSSINPCASCPDLLGIMVDGCGSEDNEYMVIWSGSGFEVNDLTLDFDTNNNIGSNINDDINLGGNCTWANPTPGLVPDDGCCTVVLAGPGSTIPANAPVIVFVSSAAMAVYDFSSLCANNVTVYVMQSSCNRDAGAFSNGGNQVNNMRTTTMGLASCGCSESLTYNRNEMVPDTDGDYVVDLPFFGVQYGNNGCAFPTEIILPNNGGTMSTVDQVDFTIPADMCNGGPYYAVGILNPEPNSCCAPQATNPLEFNVVCPIANPEMTEICLNPNGDTFIDLTQFENAISGGTGLPVNWFNDPAGQNPVPPPLNNALVDSNEPNFYVTIGSGDCISPLETFTVDIVTGSDLSGLTFELSPPNSCGNADVDVIFDFPGGNGLEVVLEFDGGDWQSTVFSGIPYFLGNFNQTTDVSLVSVTEGDCVTTFSPPLVETFTLENPPNAVPFSMETCADTNGDGLFDLTSIENIVNFGENEPVNWFEDMGSTPINFPESYTSNGSSTIFANVGTPPCVSPFVQIVLDVNPAPDAFDEDLQACEDGNGSAVFDLTTLDSDVNGNTNNNVTYYETQNTNDEISNPDNYNSNGGSVFAIVTDGDCESEFVEIVLTVTQGGAPTLLDATLCETDGLYDLTQLQDSNFPIGTWSGNGVSGDFFNPNGQVPEAILTFSPDGDCAQDGMSTITVNAAETPELLDTEICETDGPINLNDLVIDNTLLPGTWSGDGVQNDGMTFDPTGQPNSVVVTFVSDTECTNSETATITIQSANTVTLEEGETCETDGLFNLDDLLPANAPTGTWSGTGVQPDGTNFDPSGLLGENMVTFTPDENCATGGTTSVFVFGEETTEIEQTFCSGSGDFVEVGPDIYDEDNPVGTTVLTTEFGCDSTINVTLTYTTPTPGTYENTLCPGSSEEVGGVTFDETMPSGTVTLTSPSGCDSMVMVTITFEDEVMSDLEQTFCSGSGDFVEVGPDIYNESNPTGMTTVQTPDGCDSTINVTLTYTTPMPGTYENTLCPGSSEEVGGVTFDETMPSGTVTLTSPSGCDSMVMVTITFEDEVMSDLEQTFCSGSGDFVEVGPDIYNESNPTGMTTVQTPDGCDSTINVTLTYTTPTPGTYENTLCPGSSEEVGGVIFDETMPSGTVTLTSPSGCDSMVMVTITFENEVMSDLEQTFCSGSGDFVEVGPDIYNETNPTGMTTVQTPDGCDSTINVTLTYTTPTPGTYENTLCPGSSEEVGGVVFDETMPSGTVTLTSPSGCDSMVMVTITFENEIMSDLEQTFCSGSGDFVEVGPDIYNETNPTGMTTVQTPDGCDSTINVTLTYTTPTPGTYENTLCPGSSEEVGGVVFDETMPSGTVTLLSPSGCDSMVMVTITFENEIMSDLEQTFCSGSGDFVEVGPDIYNETNPTGMTTVQTPDGCDSTINVTLTYTTPTPGTYENTLCPGSSEEVGGVIFDEAMPSGTVTLTSPSGCDSMVMVTITFEDEVMSDLEQTFCSGSGDFVEVGPDIYNETNPTGMTTVQTPDGCDSTINVTLTYTTPTPGIYENTLCTGSSEEVGGVIFDETMPSGTVTLTSPSGCDSMVMVTITFENEVVNNIENTYCSGSGEFVEVGTDIYDEANPMGTTMLQTPQGCDSIVNVDLTYITPMQGTYENTLCTGGSEMIGGITFDEAMPSGIATLQTPLGCDSMVMVTLTFENEVVNNIENTYCSGSGEFVEVGTDIYDEANPMGTTMLQTPQGCDSIVNVDLTYITPMQGTYENTLCTGGSEMIGGITFDEAMPSGIATLQTPLGCDSMVMVTLTFSSEVVVNIMETLCPGESIEIDGVTYDENNTMGSTTIPNGSYLGCDSTTNVSISFYPEAISDFTTTLDVDETIEIGGVIFSVDNPNGTVTLPMSSVNGCDSTINVDIQFTTEFMVEAFAFAPFCPNENTGGITIDTIENMQLPISVMLNGIPRGSFDAFPIELNDLIAGFYTLDFTGSNGGETTQEIAVPTAPPLILNVGSDQTIRLGDIVELSGQSTLNNADWQWTPPLFVECDTCLKTIATPIEQTTYVLTGTTPEGCTVADNFTVFIERGDAIFAPNVFSPNNDGVNDVFYIHATQEVAIIRNFRIFNRWGGLVFDRSEIQPNDPLMGWDGLHKGKVVDLGVYVYFAEIELVDGQKETIKGGVTVVR